MCYNIRPIESGETSIFDLDSNRNGGEHLKRGALFLASAVLHAVLIYGAFTTRWNFKIFDTGKKTREAFLAPRDIIPYPMSLSSANRFLKPGENPNDVPGRGESNQTGVVEPPAKARSAEPKAEANPAAGGEAGGTGTPAGGGGTGPGGPPGVFSGFKLTYPADAKISLAIPASKVEDTLLSPGRYQTRTDIDFSRYLNSGGLAGGPGAGSGGSGRGRPSQRARRQPGNPAVSMSIPKADLSHWGETVLNKVQRNWALAPGAGSGWKGEVGISVLVAKSGEVLAVELDAPSKIEILDQAAVKSLWAASPFPPLPTAYSPSRLEVYFVFKYGD